MLTLRGPGVHVHSAGHRTIHELRRLRFPRQRELPRCCRHVPGVTRAASMQQSLGPAFVAGLAVRERVGAGSNGAVVRVQPPPDPAAAAAASANASGEEDRREQRLASTATLSTQPFALKVVSHFWSEEALQSLDVERKSLTVSAAATRALRAAPHAAAVPVTQRLPPHPNIIRCYGVDKVLIPPSIVEALPDDMASVVSLAQPTEGWQVAPLWAGMAAVFAHAAPGPCLLRGG